MSVHRSPANRPRLHLQPLEGRIVPNGTIKATLSPAGALSLTGDDDANDPLDHISLLRMVVNAAAFVFGYIKALIAAVNSEA